MEFDLDTINRKIINWLIVQRNLSGKTQLELSLLLGKPQSYVSKYETFERKLSVNEFLYICRVLSCNPINIIQEILNYA